jgi:glucosamine 6-phosphate synthetase-like amidotransferase/phosphosugar isomerase protein
MCGIAGFLSKRAGGPTASTVLGSMLKGLRSRGPDSTGLGLYAPYANGSYVVRVWCNEDEAAAEAAAERARAGLGVGDHDYAGGILRFRVPADVPVAEICRAVEGDADDVEVFSVGRALQIYKHVTDGEELARHYGLEGSPGRHGVGHTRLATESRVDVQHAHPFWARPFADICVVHNGHITNYHKLRKLYELKGHRFFTGNDSELLALYLAQRLEGGESIREAMEASIRDLDGSFSYLLATADGLGVARDRVGSMPAVIAECDDWVAVASEGIAVHQAFGEAAEEAEFRELGVGRVQTWAL